MLGLPKSTEMNKLLPKKAIYAKFQMNTAAKDRLDADISRISIVAEISPNTTSIAAGQSVQAYVLQACAERMTREGQPLELTGDQTPVE